MPNYNGLYEQIKTIATNAVTASSPTSIVFGSVETVSPLSIKINEKMVLTDSFLVLSSLVSDFNVKINIDDQTEAETDHTHVIHDTYTNGGSSEPTTHRHDITGSKTIRINLSLSVGEKVILLQVQGGQKYIVLDRAR